MIIGGLKMHQLVRFKSIIWIKWNFNKSREENVKQQFNKIETKQFEIS